MDYSIETRRVTLRDGRVVLLRPPLPTDAADLLVIRRHVIEENISNIGTDIDTLEEQMAKLATPPEERLWVIAEHEGQVIGSLDLKRPAPRGMHHQRLLGIEVHREWRGAGVGSALIHHAIEWARAHGVEMILLGVLDSNPRARRLYERLGFTRVGHIPRFVKRPDGTYTGDTRMVLYLDRE